TSMLSKIARFLKRQSPGRVLVLATGGLMLVGYLDWITGPDIRLGIFCLIPLVLATYFAGPRTGMVMAVLTAVMWLFLDLAGRKHYTHPPYAYFNAVVRLTFFVLTTYVVTGWKAIGQRMERLVEERTAALSGEVAERKAAELSLHKLALQLADVEDAER